MILLRAALFALLSYLPAASHATDVWGRVVWSSGAPAAGVELRLLRNGTPQSQSQRIFTNNDGRYGLYSLSDPTSNYSVQIMRGGNPVRTTQLPTLKNGERVPNIVMP
jgi:hypothetical protein